MHYRCCLSVFMYTIRHLRLFQFIGLCFIMYPFFDPSFVRIYKMALAFSSAMSAIFLCIRMASIDPLVVLSL